MNARRASDELERKSSQLLSVEQTPRARRRSEEISQSEHKLEVPSLLHARRKSEDLTAEPKHKSVLPGLQQSLVYGNWLKPFWYDLSDPCEVGQWRAGSARTISISTADNVRISGWHIIPVDHPFCGTEDDFDSALRGTTINRNSSQSSLTPAPPLPSRSKLWIYFHGSSWDRGFPLRIAAINMIKHVAPDAHILVVEYRGFGDSEKVRPTEKGLQQDALAAWDWALAKGASAIATHSLSFVAPLRKIVGRDKLRESNKKWVSEHWDTEEEVHRIREFMSDVNKSSPSDAASSRIDVLIVHGVRDKDITLPNALEIFKSLTGVPADSRSKSPLPPPLTEADGSLYAATVAGGTENGTSKGSRARLFTAELGTHTNLPSLEVVPRVVRAWVNKEI
ncbi:hypothetical protein HDU93_004176 [Gonapodya sp. JEL0774]|nr:hypothetical protein HDU93_004176 [Gonapodya sp. JEL0774]